MIEMEISVEMKQALKSFDSLLNDRDRKNAMRSVKTAGANVIRDKAHKDAGKFFDDHTGKLRGSLKRAKTGIYKSRKGWVGVLAGGDNAPHAHLVEFGSARGMPATRFLATTAEDSAQQARTVAQDKFIKYVDNKLKKKSK